jgi:hypothetical protein
MELVLIEIIIFIEDDRRLSNLISLNMICHNGMNSRKQMRKTSVLENSCKFLGFYVKPVNINNT